MWGKSDRKYLFSGAEMIRKEENLGQGWDNPGFKGYARQEKAETGLQASFLLVK